MANVYGFGITNPPIDDLVEKTGSKYALAAIASSRARQIISYYSQLGDGLLEHVGPLVEYYPQEKALSIAMREIGEDRLNIHIDENVANNRTETIK